jgi:hypothetical protein
MKPFKNIVIGLSLALSLLFLQAVPAYAEFTQQTINSGLCAGSSGVVADNSAAANCNGDDATDKINSLIQTIVNLLSAVVGVVAVIMIIVGGLRYITSGGNDTSVTGAKNTILYAIIGLIIVALAQLIVHFVLNKVTNS